MGYTTFSYEKLNKLAVDVFLKEGFNQNDSEAIADALLTADLFGIESHGVQRLIRYHRGVAQGRVDVKAQPQVVFETPVSAVVDANHASGQLASHYAMDLAIKKAKQVGIGMVTVRHSAHHGIESYYANLAMKNDLIGIAMTNSDAIAVPTGGKRAMLGTNPISVAMPADPYPFIYDAATTIVPRGKIEVFNKLGKPLPAGWALDENGVETNDAALVLSNIINKVGGGIQPMGGHKGYGLAVFVELCTSILSGGPTSYHMNEEGKEDTSHCFWAIDYGIFGDKAEIKANMSKLLEELRNGEKAVGVDRILTHGQLEMTSMAKKLEEGIPVNDATYEELRGIASDLGLNFEEYLD